MPSVRVEAEAFSDERFSELAAHAGLADADHARGKMLRLWRQCTLEQTHLLPADTVNRIIGDQGVAALISSRLGEMHCCHLVRIRGTQGRIEWLQKLRSNGRYGELGGRPKRLLTANPQGLEELTPLTLTLAPTLTNSDPPIAPQKSPRRGRPPRAKPSDPTAAEMATVRLVLGKLGARNGVRYEASKQHTALIVARLRDGATERDLRAVIGYCATQLEWQGDPKFEKYLRPETLFGPTTIARYLDAARTWAEAESVPFVEEEPNP